MTLISLLVVLMLEHFFKVSALLEKELKVHTWFPQWRQWISGQFSQQWFSDWGGIIIIVGVPVLLISLISGIDGGPLFWILQLALSAMVIIYCLDPIDQNTHLAKYFKAVDGGDYQSAFHHVEDYLNVKTSQKASDDIKSLGRTVTRIILLQSNFRYFAVLMYFVLLGPAAALLYRLVSSFEFSEREEDSSPYANKLEQIRTLLDWFPARMTGFLYALAGDFSGAMSQLKDQLFNVNEQNKQILEETGLGALGIKNSECEDVIVENKQALDLVYRAVIVFLVILSVLTVFGWLS